MHRRLAIFALCIIGVLAVSLGRPPEPPDSVTLYMPGAWAPIDKAPERFVLLVHGLDEPGSIWDEVAPAVYDHGVPVARFTYPNDQPIADSALLLQEALSALEKMGADRVVIVCHSMGGLVARDAITRPEESSADDGARDIIERVISIGTPYSGAQIARLRIFGELREQAIRAATGEPVFRQEGDHEFQADGNGEAGVDLLPGSDFLTDLYSRPTPSTPITVIAGRLSKPVGAAKLVDKTWVRALVGSKTVDAALAKLDDASAHIGDGVVTLQSATYLDAPDTIILDATHRGMLRKMGIEQTFRRATGDEPHDLPPAIPVILERLDEG